MQTPVLRRGSIVGPQRAEGIDCPSIRSIKRRKMKFSLRNRSSWEGNSKAKVLERFENPALGELIIILFSFSRLKILRKRKDLDVTNLFEIFAFEEFAFEYYFILFY